MAEDQSMHWTDVLTAFGTVGAVVVALFGYFIPKFFPPRLVIRIANVEGSPQKVQLINQTGAIPVQARDAQARYYHIEVSNARRWAKAHNVNVLLSEIEEETTAGWTKVWSGGGIPLIWQHEHTMGGNPSIGRSRFADLFHVVQDVDPARVKWLELTPKFAPYGVEMRRSNVCKLRLTVQAAADEGDSSALCLILAWDGQWMDGSREMAQHVRVTEDRQQM